MTSTRAGDRSSISGSPQRRGTETSTAAGGMPGAHYSSPALLPTTAWSSGPATRISPHSGRCFTAIPFPIPGDIMRRLVSEKLLLLLCRLHDASVLS
ncbi:MAG: hypothetical protein MZV63_70615 [Marinilabiliales bacterium]|nr:hypothetical protein [Marinilabiliales bacterium]